MAFTKHRAAVIALAGLIATSGHLALAQNSPARAPANGQAQLPANDADFVRMLEDANTTELDMAKVVVDAAKDPAVRAFAQRMIDDHSTAAVQLEAATRGAGLRIMPREGAGPRTDRGLTRLQGESGAQLDADYMRMQIEPHRRVLAVLQWEAQNGTNVRLKTLATNLAPTVQQHLQLAQDYLEKR